MNARTVSPDIVQSRSLWNLSIAHLVSDSGTLPNVQCQKNKAKSLSPLRKQHHYIGSMKTPIFSYLPITIVADTEKIF